MEQEGETVVPQLSSHIRARSVAPASGETAHLDGQRRGDAVVELPPADRHRVVCETVELDHQQLRESIDTPLLARRHARFAALTVPRILAFQPLPLHQRAKGVRQVVAALHPKLQIAPCLPTAPLPPAGEAAQRGGGFATEEILQQQPIFCKGGQEEGAELVGVMLR